MTTNCPATLGKYRIERVLGEGAMGVVYKGFDPMIERAVAIKTIRKHLIDESPAGAETAARFRNEARAAGRLLHPSIVAIHEYGEGHDGAADVAYIAMEYVEGITVGKYLARHVDRGDTIPLTDALDIMTQLLSALDYAHAQGVWHRDVKPANLILSTNGTLKVADFGIARLENTSFTQVNAVIGTPSHMAPEQIRGEAIDRRIDIFAAGVVLYQLLTNRLPFSGNASTMMYNVVNAPVPPPSTVEGVHAPSQFDAIIACALAKDPNDRYQTAQEFKDALRLAARMSIAAPQVGASSPFNQNDETVELDASTSAIDIDHPTNATTAVPSDFDSAWLAKATQCIARQVGPIAKIMVRKASATARTRAAFVNTVCQQIDDRTERAALDAALKALR